MKIITMREQIEAKLQEIMHMNPTEAKAYDTAITWAFVSAVTGKK